MRFDDVGFTLVFRHIVGIALHSYRVDAHLAEVSAFQHRLLRAFHIQYPDVYVMHMQLS